MKELNRIKSEILQEIQNASTKQRLQELEKKAENEFSKIMPGV